MIHEKHNLLNETIQYYSADPLNRRCVSGNSGGGCKYSGKTVNLPLSDGCAIGRLLSPELRLDFDSRGTVSVGTIFSELPENIQAYGLPFLKQLQVLHDSDYFWNSNGLSISGLDKAAQIRNSIDKELY